MRQRRDKGPAKADTSDDNPRAIPHDAKGVPIFLILPPGLRAKYEKQMEQCEAAWREGEQLAIAEAVTCTHIYRQPIPKWLEQAVVELAIGRRTAKQAKRYTEAEIRLQRYMTVRDLKLDIDFSKGTVRRITDISWDGAYEKAAEMLAGTQAAGSADTMKADYRRVQCDLKTGHSGKYFNLKDRRYRRNGQPDLH